MKKLLPLLLALSVSSCFAQSALTAAQESWISEKETQELARLRKDRPDSVVVKFDFAATSPTRVVTTPSGKTHTFIGDYLPKKPHDRFLVWMGEDKTSHATLTIATGGTDGGGATLVEGGRDYSIISLGGSFAIISEHNSTADSIKHSPEDHE